MIDPPPKNMQLNYIWYMQIYVNPDYNSSSVPLSVLCW